MKKLGKKKEPLTQRREVTKSAKETKGSYFGKLGASAYLREVLHFFTASKEKGFFTMYNNSQRPRRRLSFEAVFPGLGKGSTTVAFRLLLWLSRVAGVVVVVALAREISMGAGQARPAPAVTSAEKPADPPFGKLTAVSEVEPQRPAEKPGPPAPQAPAPEGQLKEGAQPALAPTTGVSFRLENSDLLQFINLVAGQLKMNYVVDPAVKGIVTISTLGELRTEDLFPILQSVLKINGATAVRVGPLYRIVPMNQAARAPGEVSSEMAGKALPEDDRLMMRILPLRFVFAADMAKMLTPFLSDTGSVTVHETGNVLILVDTSLNLRRLGEIIEQFDSASFAQQRIQLVAVHNNVASGLIPELESIFSAYALSDKRTPLRFIPLDRINTILVVTADPSAFQEVEKWVEKLDQPAPPSGVQTFIYRVKNSEADYLAKLLLNMQGRGISLASAAGGGAGGAAGPPGGAGPATREAAGFSSEEEAAQAARERVRISTDPVNNSLIIQSTPQQYAEIARTLKELDVIPRQVMIEARVYEVTLTGTLSFGISYFLEQRSTAERKPLASFSEEKALQASVGTLVGHTRELLTFLNASENRSRVRVLSAPTVLAMDNSDAKIQVGSEVPILTSQAVVGGVAVGATNLFSNTITNRDTGIILTVVPRITSTGLVSLKITEEISEAEPPPAGTIQSPSFRKRSISTRAVAGDGETIALGGLIQQSITTTRNRIPLLGDIPVLGALFGNTSYSKTRTELIVVLTPHIVKDVEAARGAARELREGLRELRRSFKKDTVVNP